MFGRKRFDPERSNVLGESNQDTNFGPEFTFHHGHVEQVIMSQADLQQSGASLSAEGITNLSQLVVFTPTYGENLGFSLPSNYLKSKQIALPLYRGFSDSIATGDSIIFTQLGDNFYYIGPINTYNDPNYCPDSIVSNLNPDKIDINTTELNEDGYSVSYKQVEVEKLTKAKSELDRAFNTGIGDVDSFADVKSVFSDIQIEGRHNNSIQLGTRFINPYTIVKNNHSEGNLGSVIGMTSFGSLLDNFPNKFSPTVDLNNESVIREGLSSDLEIVKKQSETPDGEYKGFSIGYGNDVGPDENKPENKFNMNFGEEASTPGQQTEFDQIIMFSDRITFDAQDNDFTVSAFRNINFGAVGNFTITNKGFSVIESKNIYIGQHAKEKKEPMVLGDELRLLLLDIMKILLDSRALVQGVALPLVDKAPGTLMDIRINQMIKKLEDMRTTPENSFLSDYHYIEPNAGNPNRS